MKKNRGITLIALVVTIVVLLVLVAVSINVAFGNNGIFQKAKEAASTTADQIDYESNRLPELMQAYINENVGNTVGDSNSAPSDFSVTLTSKETNSITVTAKATDLDGEDLSYTLYTKIEDGTYEAKNTSDATASGTEVTLTATGLAQYTTYNYYVAVSDGKKTINSEEASVRTYCPTTKCEGPFTTTTTCSNCGGDGKITRYRKCTGTAVGGGHFAYSTKSVCDICGTALHYESSKGKYYGFALWPKCNKCDAYNLSVSAVSGSYFTCLHCASKIPGYGEPCSPSTWDHNESYQVNCGSCSEGTITTENTCSHGKSATHYYCEHGDDYTTEVHD